ncbi:hypothetical protein I656_03943 [Geobacillus sp. WSUCF1]|nr:hypothetical protein I656_03943 [Geobacillus sp. WSUCF1]
MFDLDDGLVLLAYSTACSSFFFIGLFLLSPRAGTHSMPVRRLGYSKEDCHFPQTYDMIDEGMARQQSFKPKEESH